MVYKYLLIYFGDRECQLWKGAGWETFSIVCEKIASVLNGPSPVAPCYLAKHPAR